MRQFAGDRSGAVPSCILHMCEAAKQILCSQERSSSFQEMLYIAAFSFRSVPVFQSNRHLRFGCIGL